MQSQNNIPWNVTPRNGINSFFSEESYAKWFGRESHESRLAENLKKVGITLPPAEPRKTGQEASKLDLEVRKHLEVRKQDIEATCAPNVHLEVKSETGTAVKSTTTPAGETARPRKYPVKHQKNVSATNTITTMETSLRQEKGTDVKTSSLLPETSLRQDKRGTDVQTSSLLPEEASPFQGNASSGNSEGYEQQEGNIKSETGTIMDPSRTHKDDRSKKFTEPTDDMNIEETQTEEMAVSSEVHTDTANPLSATSLSRPSTCAEKSLVKAEQLVDSMEIADDSHVESLDNKSWRSMPTDHIDGNAPRPDVPSSLSSDNKRPTTKEEIKRLKAENLFYFNQKDRPDKYMPIIFRMKPKNKKSQLTVKEQRFFFNMNRAWSSDPPLAPPPGFNPPPGSNPSFNPLIGGSNEDRNAEQYKNLAGVVKKEQGHYQAYLKYAASKCEADYRYIHPDADKYITARLQAKKRRVWAYPRYYKNVGKICLRDPHGPPVIHDSATTPTLQFVRPLAEMGHVPKLVLPSIVPGCPQPCTPTSFKEVSSVCPPIRDKAEGPLVWDHQECSCDPNIEQLAVPNKCDISLTATTLRYLIDNQGYHSKFWDMPVTVKEYNVSEGTGHVVHRVVYLDKPIVQTSEYLMRDKHLMYQKYALKTAALRPKQKMVVFSQIKPVANIIKAPEQDAVVKEIESWEKNVKDTLIVYSGDENSANDSDDPDEEKNAKPKGKNKKRRRKKKGAAIDDEPGEKGVGVFNIEKDIDELEMFGMDTLPKIKTANTKAEDGGAKGKTAAKRSVESDLELLKGITSLAKKDVQRATDVCKQTVKTAVETSKRFDVSTAVLTGGATSARELTQYKETISTDSASAVAEQSGVEEKDLQSTKPIKEMCSETVSETVEVPASETESKPANRKPRKLSVDNVSSLSGMMQRMSTVKAKLQQRVQLKTNLNESTQQPDGTVTLSTPNQSQATATVRPPIETPAHNVDLKPASSDSDSDADSDGLVIDVPEGTPVERPSKTKKNKPNAGKSKAVFHETIESTPASPIEDMDTPQSPDLETPQSPDLETPRSPDMETPQSPDMETPQSPDMDAPQSPDMDTPQSPGLETPQTPVFDTPFSPDTSHTPSGVGLNKPCVIIPCGDTNEEEVVRDYTMVTYEQSASVTPTAYPTIEPASSVKQEHHDMVTNIKTEVKQEPELSAPVTRGSKRRSSEIGKPEAIGSRKVLRSTVSKETNESSVGNVEDEASTAETPAITTRGRGRKRELTKERNTRSRSVSKESQGTSLVPASRRVTRHSLESSRASLESLLHSRETTKMNEEQSADPEVPVKRKRGRPPKKSTDNPKDISEDSHSIPQASTSTDVGDTDQTRNDTTSEINKTVPDLHKSRVDSVNVDQPLPKRRGRPPKKSTDDPKVISDNNKSIPQTSTSVSGSQDQINPDHDDVADTEQTKNDTKSDVTKTGSDNNRLRVPVVDSVHEDQPMPRRRGRPPKKTSQSLVETNKVQEMREALKKRLAAAEEEKSKKLAVEEEERAKKIAAAGDLKKSTLVATAERNWSKNPVTSDESGGGISMHSSLSCGLKTTAQGNVQRNTDLSSSSRPSYMNNTNPVDNKTAVPSQGHMQMQHGYQTMTKPQQSSQATYLPSGSQVMATGYQNFQQGSQVMTKQNVQQGSQVMGQQTTGINQPHGKTSTIPNAERVPTRPPAVQGGTASAGGLDSILSMQSDLLKSPEVKGSNPEQFARQHGMQTALFPLEGNLAYNLWTLGETKVLVRCSYHGHSNPQGIVHVTPKIEYQPNFGFERETVNETCKNWISVYLRPNSTLVRARINPYNSEVMLLETVNFKDLIPPDSGFKPLKAFADMNTIFEELKTLTPGQYVLRNNPHIGKMSVHQATDEAFKSFDLHKQHTPLYKGREGRVVLWQPIDTQLLLPHHKSRQLVPCMYPALDQEGQAFVPKKKKGKKKKFNKEQAQD